VTNGQLWRTGKTDELPKFEVLDWESDSRGSHETGTRVQIADVEIVIPEHEDLFAQSVEILTFLLRTRTAVGYLKHRLSGADDDLNIAVSLAVRELDGAESLTQVPFDFLWPDELLGSPTSVVLLEDYASKASKLSDKQKAQELGGKALLKVGSTVRSGHDIKYYAFFAPSRALRRDMSAKNRLVWTDEDGAEEHLMRGGIFVGSRGMPTGIEMEHPSTGYAGYWPNFFIFLEDDFITFDVGRKAIPNRTKGMLRDIAKELFNEIQPYSVYATKDPATSAKPIAAVQQHAKAQNFAELERLSDLKLDALRYIKHPDGQEAAVVALFHELVGAGILPYYKTLRTGYRETYDWWGRYQAPAFVVGKNLQAQFASGVDLNIVIEHKFRAENILSDLDKDVKFFTDMDPLVCWDLDPMQFKKQSVDVSLISPDDVLFFGSNYVLSWPGAYDLGSASQKPVMALRRLIEDLVVAKSAGSANP
jgi:molecular chaperone HtpG